MPLSVNAVPSPLTSDMNNAFYGADAGYRGGKPRTGLRRISPSWKTEQIFSLALCVISFGGDLVWCYITLYDYRPHAGMGRSYEEEAKADEGMRVCL